MLYRTYAFTKNLSFLTCKILPFKSGEKKGVFINFAKFTGKHLYQSHLFFNKVAGHYSKNTFSYRIPRMAASEVKHLSKQEHNSREMRAAKRVTIFHSKTKLVH